MQNFQIIVVDDRKLLDAIGNIEYQVSDTFIQENYQQLSFSEEELLRKKVGVLASMFPPELRTPLGKQKKGSEETISFLRRTIHASAVILIAVYDPSRRAPASEGDFLGIMSLGCVMENMWLMAQALGIGFHVLSALSVDAVEKEVKRILAIPEHLRIGFACRLGYPISTPSKYLRVRREVKDLTHYNRFGNKKLD
jgi:nitroreductase